MGRASLLPSLTLALACSPRAEMMDAGPRSPFATPRSATEETDLAPVETAAPTSTLDGPDALTVQWDGVPTLPAAALPKPRPPGAASILSIDDTFWAERGTLDVIHLRPGEFEALEAAAREGLGDDDEPRWLSEHSALETLRTGDQLQAIHPDGPVRSATVGTVLAEPGASGLHLFVKLKSDPSLPGDALVVRGIVDSTARLRPTRPRASSGEQTQSIVDSLRASVPATFRDIFESRVVSLAGPVADCNLVTVEVVTSEDDEYRGFSGLFVVQPDGTLLDVVEPGARPHRFVVRYLVDVYGDGIDEIVFESDYRESSGYVYLAVWDGERYVNLQLSGDGG